MFKMQLLNKFSEILHKLTVNYFYKIIVLKAASYSNPISNFKTYNVGVSWEIRKFLEQCFS